MPKPKSRSLVVYSYCKYIKPEWGLLIWNRGVIVKVRNKPVCKSLASGLWKLHRTRNACKSLADIGRKEWKLSMLKLNWSYRVESQRYMITIIVFVIFVVIRLRNYYAFLHSQQQKNWQNSESMILYSVNSTIALLNESVTVYATFCLVSACFVTLPLYPNSEYITL